MHGNRTIYGYVNCAAFNVDADGDRSWFATRELRDRALAGTRAWAISRGLSVSASRSGIYPVKARAGAQFPDRDDREYNIATE